MVNAAEATANIGVVGLAVMGRNLARNLASRKGNTVAIYNRSPERTELLVNEHPEAGFIPAKTIEEFAAVVTAWNQSELESYLIEITAEVLKHVDAKTGKPFVDVVLDQAGSKGTGVWTVQTALDLGVPVSGIAEAVFARSLSSHPQQRAAAAGLPSPAKPWTVEDRDAFVEDIRLALYASKIIAYSQGFDAIHTLWSGDRSEVKQEGSSH